MWNLIEIDKKKKTRNNTNVYDFTCLTFRISPREPNVSTTFWLKHCVYMSAPPSTKTQNACIWRCVLILDDVYFLLFFILFYFFLNNFQSYWKNTFLTCKATFVIRKLYRILNTFIHRFYTYTHMYIRLSFVVIVNF